MDSFEGKVAIITGAATGIGRAFADALAVRGASVFLCDIQDPSEAVAELSARGFRAGGTMGDIADPGTAERVVKECEEAFGRLDILVNSAGLASGLEPRPFDRLDMAEWQRVMDVNLTGTFRFCRAVLPAMRRAGAGRIINITSATVFSTPPNMLHYIASKGALTAMTKGMARELGRDNITVNALAPGFTLSSGVLNNLKDSYQAQAERTRSTRAIPSDQMPEDLCGALVFLAGDASAMVTGQVLVVDGGVVMH